MNKLNKGTKIKVALVMDRVKSITINFDENGNVKGTILNKEPPFIAELKEDLLLENFEDTDNRLAYIYKGKTYISDKIENITSTKIMKLPHDNGIEINLHNERYLIETESNAYYIELLNQGN